MFRSLEAESQSLSSIPNTRSRLSFKNRLLEVSYGGKEGRAVAFFLLYQGKKYPLSAQTEEKMEKSSGRRKALKERGRSGLDD